jgi:uncharacterized protein
MGYMILKMTKSFKENTSSQAWLRNNDFATPHSIEGDVKRLREIVEGEVRENLEKYIEQRELTGRQGEEIVRIPLNHITLPRFKYDDRQVGGVGQGDGDIGQPIGKGRDNGQSGPAGTEPGEHHLEVTIERLAKIVIEELNLELPIMKPLLFGELHKKTYKVGGPAKKGVLHHKPASFKEAMKREYVDIYNFDDKGKIAGIRPGGIAKATSTMGDKNKIKREVREKDLPSTDAVFIMACDISGSMSPNKRKALRIINELTEEFLRNKYRNVEVIYVVYEVNAKVVTKKEFYELSSSGGTRISSAFGAISSILNMNIAGIPGINVPIDQKCNPYLKNVYIQLGTDGESGGHTDDENCKKAIKELAEVCRIVDCVLVPGERNQMYALPFVKMYENLGKQIPPEEGIVRAQLAKYIFGSKEFGIAQALQTLYGERRGRINTQQ